MMICAHCGGPARGDELSCPTCGRAFIPDLTRGTLTLGETPPVSSWAVPATATAPLVAPVSEASRTWALAAHLMAIAGALLGGIAAFVGPLVVWLLRRDDPFAAEHARQALNFNLSVLVYAVVGGIAAVVAVVLTLGIALIVVVPGLAVAVVGYFVVSVVAAAAAARGRHFRYPLTLPIVR